MKKLLLLSSCLLMLLSSLACALDYDTKQTMKAMKTSYIHSMKATELTAFKHSLSELDELLVHAKTLPFPKEKKTLFLQGLDKVSSVIVAAQDKADQGQLQQAQAIMEQVDSLRKEYHDQRNESIWKRIIDSVFSS